MIDADVILSLAVISTLETDSSLLVIVTLSVAPSSIVPMVSVSDGSVVVVVAVGILAGHEEKALVVPDQVRQVSVSVLSQLCR